MRILLTRPQADAQRTAAALRARGHEVIIAPLFDLEILPDADLGDGSWSAILVTSANAVRAISGHRRRDELRALAVFTVGDRTAQAMRDCGFTNVASAGGNVNDLAGLVAAHLKPPSHLLYLAGEERSGDLAGLLRGQNFGVHTALVYRAVEDYIGGADVTLMASMAKLKAGRLAREVSDSCLQYWGGMGYTWDNPVSRAYRDGRLGSIGGGADEVMLGIICKLEGTLPRKGP